MENIKLSDRVDIEDPSLYENARFDALFRTAWTSGLGQYITDIDATYCDELTIVFEEDKIEDPKEIVRRNYENMVSFNLESNKGQTAFTENFVVNFRFNKHNEYISLEFEIAAKNKEIADKEIERIRGVFPSQVDKILADIQWHFPAQRGIQDVNFRNVIYETFHNEAYPQIENLDEWTKSYLKSKSSLLFLYGSPGTGKTKLIRKILKESSKLPSYKEVPKVLYLSGEETTDFESVFVDFLNQDYDFLVIEDLDQKVKPRSEGNSVMSTLLASSDGLVSSINKKIMITTNLPNLNEARIDNALLRPGRCFDSRKLTKLKFEEAKRFYNKVFGDDNVKKLEESKEYPLSDLYHLGEEGELSTKNEISESTGFTA